MFSSSGAAIYSCTSTPAIRSAPAKHRASLRVLDTAAEDERDELQRLGKTLTDYHAQAGAAPAEPS
jgi:hypothetical protein